MPASQRLLIVVNDAGFFLSHRLSLALGVRDAGYDVHVATPFDDAVCGITDAGLTHHPFRLSRRGTSPAGELRAVGDLVTLYRRVRPDIVHHVTAKPILYGGVAARVTNVPATVHAVSGLGFVFISDAPRARALRRAIRAAYRVATSHPNCAVIFQNDDDRRVFGSAIRTSHVAMIPGSGVDLKVFRPSPLPRSGKPLVVLPSRMLADKGVGEFVEAARSLRARGVEARFALVGGIDAGNPAGIARARIDEWVRGGAVEWWGLRKDMANVMAESTIVCLPSYREGMPKTLLEATAAGRPIVSTDVPGCRDIVTRAANGRLVAPRNATALANALEAMLTDREELERFARASSAYAPQVSVAKVIQQTLDVYRELERRSRRAANGDRSAHA